MGCEGVERIQLAQGMGQWWAVTNTVVLVPDL
jgi:hypothetical protein